MEYAFKNYDSLKELVDDVREGNIFKSISYRQAYYPERGSTQKGAQLWYLDVYKYIYLNDDYRLIFALSYNNYEIFYYVWGSPIFYIENISPVAIKRVLGVLFNGGNLIDDEFTEDVLVVHFLAEGGHPEALEMMDYLKSADFLRYEDKMFLQNITREEYSLP